MNEYPNVLEQEKALLSAMIQYGDNVIPTVASIVTAEDFYRPDHCAIFDATVAVYEQKQEPNILLVEEELAKRGVLARIDRKYLFSLLECEYTSTRAEQYAQTIKEMSTRRRIISLCKKLANGAGDTTTTIEDLVAKAEQITGTLTSGATKQPWRDSADLIYQGLMDALARGKNQGLNGVRTGLHDLDLMTGGLKPANLIILAARPAMGKTALAMNIALAAARDVPVLIFSLEMSSGQLTDRVLSMVAQVPISRIADGILTQRECQLLSDCIDMPMERNWAIDDTVSLSIAELKMRARHFKHKKGLGLIVIDYLQLIRSSSYTNNRVQEVSEVSRELKNLARELNVPVLALSQLSRNLEMRADKRPQLSDLRESGSIEQDADMVMFLYRDEYYNRDTDDQNIAELMIAKNRNGATGFKRFIFDAQIVQFRDFTKRES